MKFILCTWTKRENNCWSRFISNRGRSCTKQRQNGEKDPTSWEHKTMSFPETLRNVKSNGSQAQNHVAFCFRLPVTSLSVCSPGKWQVEFRRGPRKERLIIRANNSLSSFFYFPGSALQNPMEASLHKTMTETLTLSFSTLALGI